METLEQAAREAESPGPGRQKRSRTGCLTCRNRRRKCDEGKPECQNCVSKGFDCNYPAAFQFLGKNNFTPVTPAIPKTPKYSKVKFVSDADAEKQNEEHEEEEDDAGVQVAQDSTSPNTSVVSPLNTTDIEPDVHPTGRRSSAENYEVALHGLLALGASDGLPDADTSANAPSTLLTLHSRATLDGAIDTWVDLEQDNCHTGFRIDDPSWQQLDFTNKTLARHDDISKVRRQTAVSAIRPCTAVKVDGIVEEKGLELVRFYRYNIAPWLDICDMKQTFGCEVLQQSTESEEIRKAVCALAESASHMSGPEMEETELPSSSDYSKRAIKDVVDQAVLDALRDLQEVIPHVSEYWTRRRIAGSYRKISESLAQKVEVSSIAAAVSWLLVRIGSCIPDVNINMQEKLTAVELSVGLINMMCMDTSIPTVTISHQSWPEDNLGQVLTCAHRAVALCSEAVRFTANGDSPRLQGRGNRVEAWYALIRDFEQWYADRPQDFHSVVELYPSDGQESEDEFPTIVFASGAAILANQLYHTGMMVLLRNKPRFSNIGNMRSSSSSVLWHTRRVCGIAINNDRRECWDLSLVSSLLLVAKDVTHRSQHAVITDTLHRVQQLTGWNFAQHVHSLHNEWRTGEGW